MLWNKAFFKGAYSRPSCTISSSRRLQTWHPRVSSGQRHHGRFGIPEEENGAGGQREATAGGSVLATPLWDMLYADNAGVVSRLPEQLRKMMEVIVVVCAVFGLTVSEAKTDIMCLRAKGARVHRHIQRRGSGPGEQPDERV